MAEQGLDLRAATVLREHWQRQLEAAQRAADREGETIAARFVAEYDALIAALQSGKDRP